LLLLLAAGCAQEAPYTADEEQGSTHALVAVDRSRSAKRSSDVRAGALASFARIPATVDTTTALELIGLDAQLPDLNRCAVRDAGRDPSTPLSPFDRVELLAAGNVSVVVGSEETVLAPRVFPTVTDMISGVVYTTRDLAAEPLPAGQAYVIRTGGSPELDPLELGVDAPQEPASVAVGGVPLAELQSLAVSHGLEVTWEGGDAGDIVYVELSAEGVPCTVCAYDDAPGVGSVPAEAFAGSGEGRIAVHRVRSRVFEAPDIERGELRFDFEIAADVTYGE